MPIVPLEVLFHNVHPDGLNKESGTTMIGTVPNHSLENHFDGPEYLAPKTS